MCASFRRCLGHAAGDDHGGLCPCDHDALAAGDQPLGATAASAAAAETAAIRAACRQHELTVGGILRRYGGAYLQHYPEPPGSRIERTLRELAVCRTPVLGGHVRRCQACGTVSYRYHSCGNRHCPQCGGLKRAAWYDKQVEALLPVPYYHVVFTLPHELSALVLGNRTALYNLLFQAASQTLLEIAADPKHLGAKVGALLVLHTWGQQLDHHPHVHAVVTGGGLSADASRWVSSRHGWFLSVKVLAKLFRGKYLAGLKRLYQAGRLQFGGSTTALAQPANFNALLRVLYQKGWVVYAKPPLGKKPEQVLRVFGAVHTSGGDQQPALAEAGR